MPDLVKTWIGCDPANFRVGRNGHKPEGITIHLMAGSLIGTDNWFNLSPEKRTVAEHKASDRAHDPHGSVPLDHPVAEGLVPPSSSAYGIGKLGQIHQYVKEEDEAYHAGRVENPTATLVTTTYPGINPNFYLIGIEHEGQVDDDWTDAMIEASAALVAEICLRWEIPIDRTHIVKHHEIFQPKPCPGPKCPMDEIVAKALQIATPPTS